MHRTEHDALLSADWISLSDPDLSGLEVQLVQTAMSGSRLTYGPMVARFEASFARWLGREHAVSVASGTLGTWLALRALGIGPGDEVIASPHGWHQVAQAVTLAGATLVFSDINYWTGCLDPVRAATKITPATKAILAGNVNGHPAAWAPLRALAVERGIALIEDSTEAIGSRYQGQIVGTFGDVAIFDFSQPSALACGDEVKIYDTLNWSLITSIPVPAGADEGIASDPMLTRVFVTSQESDALTVIQDDGQPQVVFASDRDGNSEIYRMWPDGRNQVRRPRAGA